MNEERAKQGLSALSVSTELRDTARLRSQEIVRSFSHTRPDGSSCFTAFPDWNGTKAENIAAGYATPAKVMEGWMNSEGHRKTSSLRGFGISAWAAMKAAAGITGHRRFSDKKKKKGTAADFLRRSLWPERAAFFSNTRLYSN